MIMVLTSIYACSTGKGDDNNNTSETRHTLHNYIPSMNVIRCDWSIFLDKVKPCLPELLGWA